MPANHSKAYSILLSILTSALLLAFLLLADDEVSAQQSFDTPTPEHTPASDYEIQDLPPMQGKINPPKYRKLDSNLNGIADRVQQRLLTGDWTLPPREEWVGVTIYLNKSRLAKIDERLDKRGITPRNVGVDYIEVYVPPELLNAISKLQGVEEVKTLRFLRPVQSGEATPTPTSTTTPSPMPTSTAALNVTPGVQLHGADAWHEAGYGYKGQGLKIGILDGGFSDYKRYADLGEVPPADALCRVDGPPPYTVVKWTSHLGIGACQEDVLAIHGTMVTEVIYDIAPEATYYVAAAHTPGDLVVAVDWLIEQGVDVINMSMSQQWDGPGDGTSPYSDSPLNTVDKAIKNGIVWVNGAGNYSDRNHWYGNFTDTDGDNRLEFSSSGDECNTLKVDSTGISHADVYLRWDDLPTGSATGSAQRDLDLYVYEVDAQGNIVGESPIAMNEFDESDVDVLPLTRLFYNPLERKRLCVSVVLAKGDVPGWVQLKDANRQELEHRTASGSINNPSESANSGLLAVGAASSSDTNAIEGYSSRGPAPDGRIKPDITGVSDLYLAVAGGKVTGTSFSSPNIAGLSALVKQRFPSYTPAQVTQYLKDNAEPRGDSSPNNTWGYGFATLSTGIPTTTPTITPTPTNTPQPPGEPTHTPTITPTPTNTITPTPTPHCGPIDLGTINGDVKVMGKLDNYCHSVKYPSGNAKSYTFTISNESKVFLRSCYVQNDNGLRMALYAGRSPNLAGRVADSVHLYNCGTDYGLAIGEPLAAGTYSAETIARYASPDGHGLSYYFEITTTGDTWSDGTSTPTPTPTITPTPTVTPIPTATPAPTLTPTPTPTPTPTITSTPTNTPTPTPTPDCSPIDLGTINGHVKVMGGLNNHCRSANYPSRNAKSYTFTISSEGKIPLRSCNVQDGNGLRISLYAGGSPNPASTINN